MTKTSLQNLICWSNEHYSNLPWRKNRTLYKTLVSEFMLQQTTVATVLNHFERFLKIYPSLCDLAKASEEEVCISWKGLGYYRRARNLRNLAIQIVENYAGDIPTELDELMNLKGVGPYTANAIVAIGADKSALAVDANLERVLARFYGYKESKGPALQKKINNDFKNKKILTEINKIGARKTNEALMDLGRVICQARKASCTLCPLKKNCEAYKSGKPENFPVTLEKKPSIEHSLVLLRIVVKEKNKFLFYQKAQDQWLSGQWELPTFILESSDKNLKQYPKIKWKKNIEKVLRIKTGITKYSIENCIVEMSFEEFNNLNIPNDIDYVFKITNDKLNLSTASIKVLQKIK